MKKFRFIESSIREAFDNLPSGICFFEKNGLLVLCNRAMYRLVLQITGKDLQTLSELTTMLNLVPEVKSAEEGILQSGKGVCHHEATFFLPNRRAYRFEKTEIIDAGNEPFTQLLAYEVTDMIEGARQLAENIDKLRKTQENIRNMTTNLAGITRENEILAIKMKIHDELGSSLLQLRRYQSHKSGSKQELVKHWKQTIHMLQYQSSPEERKDPLEDLLVSAQTIGVKIVQTGDMPENTLVARVFVRAIRQCLTNAVKHAGANQIFVSITRDKRFVRCEIRNDGTPPKKEIVEGGGLSSLRTRVERIGGSMKISSLPEFVLTLWAPEIPKQPWIEMTPDRGLFENETERRQ